jgi:maltoporin
MLIGQIAYEYAENKNISFGSYGRIGVDWSFENGGSIGRRLNLNNMGSTGGRLEEQDYFEIASAMRFPSFKKEDSTRVFIQTRLSVYSNSLSLIGNSTSSSLGGLTFALPEMFVEARNIAGSGVNFWVGARLYRGPDIHIADYRYFNDHSGQGFGLELKNTRFVGLYVASTDTNATVPPYFYLNIATGTPSIALRQRSVWSIEQDIDIANNNKLTLLAEYHYMGNADSDTLIEYNYPSDYGFVGGVRFESNFQAIKNSFNRFSARYGNRIANGGDGGLSRTWMTFGAPDTISRNFHGAYSFSITDEVLLELSNKYSLNAYLIYTQSKGAAPDNGLSKTYWGREVYNRKEDFVIGTRNVFYLTDKFRLIGEAHFAQRKDGDNAMAKMLKLSFAPAFVPTGNRNYWARPEFRFISSFAFYNQYAQDNLYSPYLEFVGSKKIGYFLGIKVEWWIWN